MTRARRAKISVYRSNDEHVDLDEGFEGLLESLPADSARALIHILDCPVCQDTVLALNNETVESRAEEKPPLDEQIETLLAELLAIPQDRRAEAMKDPRFRRMELLDRVLDEAAAHCDIAYSGYLAALAIWMGGVTEPREAPPRLVRAFCLHANVQRLSGKLDAAEKSLTDASCFLSEKPEEVGLYSRILALLRWLVRSLEGLHAQVLGRIVDRWGGASAERVRERVEAGGNHEAEAWLRRCAYFPDLESTLDLNRALPVHPLSIHGLLDLFASGKDVPMTFLLLELSWFPRDWRAAEGSVPWLADLPNAERALKHLYAQGWLLVGCEQREQALLLWANVLRGRGIRASHLCSKGGDLTAR